MTTTPASENISADPAARPAMTFAGKLFLGAALLVVGGLFVVVGFLTVRETGRKAQMWNALNSVFNMLGTGANVSNAQPLIWEVRNGELFVRETSSSPARPAIKPEDGKAYFLSFDPPDIKAKPEPNGGFIQTYTFVIDENHGASPAKLRKFVFRKWIYN